MLIEHLAEGRALGDWISATVVFGTLVNWLPAVSAMLSIIWMAIRIFESATVQRLLGRTPPAKGGDDA